MVYCPCYMLIAHSERAIDGCTVLIRGSHSPARLNLNLGQVWKTNSRCAGSAVQLGTQGTLKHTAAARIVDAHLFPCMSSCTVCVHPRQALEQRVGLGDEDALSHLASHLTPSDLTGGGKGPAALRNEEVGSAASKVSVWV